ncbi:MAG: hypothetical protein SOZ27_08485 [Spirochaetia bacterium]|nr:hypothetical protein [Spirochaetia bacterium]
MTITEKLMALFVFLIMLCFAIVIIGSHLEEEEDVASMDAATKATIVDSVIKATVDAAKDSAIKKTDGEIDTVVEESTKAAIKAVAELQELQELQEQKSAVEENKEFCINKDFGTLLILVFFLGIIIIAFFFE